MTIFRIKEFGTNWLQIHNNERVKLCLSLTQGSDNFMGFNWGKNRKSYEINSLLTYIIKRKAWIKVGVCENLRAFAYQSSPVKIPNAYASSNREVIPLPNKPKESCRFLGPQPSIHYLVELILAVCNHKILWHFHLHPLYTCPSKFYPNCINEGLAFLKNIKKYIRFLRLESKLSQL